jgi:hypothetical protein
LHLSFILVFFNNHYISEATVIINMKFLKARRNNKTNLDVRDEKKLDRFLRHLAAADRKEYLKQYIKSLEKSLESAKRKVGKLNKKSKEHKKEQVREKNFFSRRRAKRKKINKEIAKRRGIIRKRD